MKYSYSDNEETFNGNCDSIGEALSEALDNYYDEEGVIYVGENTQKTIGTYLNENHVESLLEFLAEAASEECGEVADDWLQRPYIQKKAGESREDYQLRINAWRQSCKDRVAFLLDGFRIVLETWATDADEQPGFWHVGNIKSYTRDEAISISEAE